MQSKPANVNYPVNLIRTIAILMVILVHALALPSILSGTQPKTLDTANWLSIDIFAAFGYIFSLPLFVMLTGALLLDPAKADEPPRVFYKKRFNRIGIPLIFWSIVFFIWTFYVRGWPLTPFSFTQKILEGQYYHLWYLYLLIGLYAVTPILRILVKHLSHKLFTYLLVLWFAGTVIPQFIFTFTDFRFDPSVFVFTDWAGYFMLGFYLLNVKIRRSTVYLAATFGLVAAILGEWAATALAAEQYAGYFTHYTSFSVIIGSAAAFLILISIPANKVENHSKLSLIIGWIGQNTLPIYLIHPILLEILSQGILGFTLPFTGNTLVDVPALTLGTFALSALVAYPLKKVPIVTRLIG